MSRITTLLENAWLWTYTAGMPAEESDERRAEVRSDQWEFAQYARRNPLGTGERVRRFAAGVADDIAWRVSFGRQALARARRHEAILLLGIAGLVFVALPASVWWAVDLAGNPSEPQLQLYYIGTEALALACTVVGGAACAAYYPKLGRALMLAGSIGMAATLWWTPVAFIVLISAVVAVLALPGRVEGPSC